jgi:CRP/FNR family cyclic AMP-dependent transcriptional regulator
MPSILDQLRECEVRRFAAGETIIEQGSRTGRLFFLIEGEAEVWKDGVRVATASRPGVVFGELAALLGANHTATVKALAPCAFYIVPNPREFLKSSPEACLHVCELLARRLDSLNKYLVDVKQQFDGHDHIGMVDQVLETLMHRQPRERVRPSESTIRHGELTD